MICSRSYTFVNTQAILTHLEENIGEIRRRFSVAKLSIFGSFARGEGSAQSDLDVLVAFEQKATFDLFMDLKFYLEELLGIKVDLVTDKALRPRIRQAIEKVLIDVT
jgi:predicted nucleotidyltransferase